MNIIVNEELKAYIDPLTPEEYTSLERSLLTEGCRDALVLWGDVLVDGHNRYAICQAHGLPFQTTQNTQFKTMEDVHLWMIDQHLGRRSVSDFQRGVLALRKREIMADRRARAQAAALSDVDSEGTNKAAQTPPWDDVGSSADTPVAVVPLASREDIAKAARLSSNQVVLIEKIRNQAAPEVVAALKSGAISLNAAAAVASLPAPEQLAAAGGGVEELKQAARRVREAKRKPRAAPADGAELGEPVPSNPSSTDEIKALKSRIAQLEKENDALRKQVLNLLEKNSRAA